MISPFVRLLRMVSGIAKSKREDSTNYPINCLIRLRIRCEVLYRKLVPEKGFFYLKCWRATIHWC